jgi:hypothetical protein
MSAMSRRKFLRNASWGAAAAGTAVAAPGIFGPGGGSTAATVSSGANFETGSVSGGPVVAHVLDASAGKVAVYQGTRQVVVQDATLTRALTAALG